MNGRLSLFATLIAIVASSAGAASASPFTRPALVSLAAQKSSPDKLGRHKKRDSGRLLLGVAVRDKAAPRK
jgi:hypothetical protein